MDFIQRMAQYFALLRRQLARHRRVVVALACAVAFVTAYALTLPAVTLDEQTANDQPGVSLEQTSTDTQEASVDATATSDETATAAEDTAAATTDDAATTADEATEEAAATASEPQYAGATLTASDADGKYDVTVSYGEDAKLADGTTLSVHELSGSDYDAAKAKVVDAKSAAGESTDDLGVAAIDVTILDANGNPVEPADGAKVDVKIAAKGVLSDGVDSSSVEVQHLNDQTGNVDTVADAANPTGDAKVDVSDKDATADFSVSSFSTFTITYNNAHPLTVHLGYLDSSNNFVEFGDSYQVSSRDISDRTQISTLVSSYSLNAGNNDNNTIQGIYTSTDQMSSSGYSTSNYIGYSNGWNLYGSQRARSASESGLTDLYVVYDSDTTDYAAVYYIRLDGRAQQETHDGTSANGYPSSAYSKGVLASDTDGNRVIDASRVLGENPQWVYNDGADVSGSALLKPTNEDMFNAIKAQRSSFTDSQGNTIDLSKYNSASEFFEDYEVQWYVIKLHSSGTYYKDNNYNSTEINSSETSSEGYRDKYSGLWHIDGVLVKKNAVWLRYRSNIEPNDSIAPLTNTLIIDTSYNRESATNSVTVQVQGTWSNNQRVATAPARRDGAVFVHWNTKRDDTGTTYDIGDNITFSEDTTLYAIWQVPTLTVTKTYSGVESLPDGFQIGVYEGTGSGGQLITTLTPAGATSTTTDNGSTTLTWRLTNTTSWNHLSFNSSYYVTETNADVDGYTLTSDTSYGGGNSNYVTVQSKDLSKNTAAITNNYEQNKADITFKKVDQGKQDLDAATLKTGADFKLEYSATKPNADTTWQNASGTGLTNGTFSINAQAGTTISDLVDGYYQLTETKAPDGYVVLTNSITFTVRDGEILEESFTSSDASLAGSAPNYTISVSNTPGKALPDTGGRGTALLTASGAALVTLALLGLALRREAERGDA